MLEKMLKIVSAGKQFCLTQMEMGNCFVRLLLSVILHHWSLSSYIIMFRDFGDTQGSANQSFPAHSTYRAFSWLT